MTPTWRKRPPGESVDSFAVITRPANAAVAPLHDRMPAILAPELYGWWLSDGDPRSLQPGRIDRQFLERQWWWGAAKS
jgi:putative SOS response-associated peptidase YedK